MFLAHAFGMEGTSVHQSEWRRRALCLPFVALGLMVTMASEQPARVIEVKASRYDFDPSTIQVQQGERVLLRVTSTDRLHGIGIKKFGVDKEIPKGQTVDVEFVASTAGTYEVLCTEDCGKGHDDMIGTLVVTAVTP